MYFDKIAVIFQNQLIIKKFRELFYLKKFKIGFKI